MPNYKRLPVQFQRGQGAWLWDQQDRRYLDALAGIAVCGLGHALPELQQAISEQAGQILHTSNLYAIPQQQALADQLVNLSGLDQVFFANSGAEANEAAIKLARLHATHKNIKNPVIVSMHGSFHGRTLATLAATGNPAIKAGFDPLPQGFVQIPYNDIDALTTVFNNHTVVAVMLEPIQGEGGINIPDDDYLPKVRALCTQHDCLMILDEIQTGIARTGNWFNFQHYPDLQPDIMTLAKGLGNGVPIGACLAIQTVADYLQPGTHGSTFGGNPLACRAARTVLDVISNQRLIPRVQQLSQQFEQGFAALQDLPQVVEIRIKGLMIGIELNRDCTELVQQALQQGLLINVTVGKVVRLLPPLIISDEQAQQIITTVSQLIQDFGTTAPIKITDLVDTV